MEAYYTALYVMGFSSFVVAGILLVLWALTPACEPVVVRENVRKP